MRSEVAIYAIRGCDLTLARARAPSRCRTSGQPVHGAGPAAVPQMRIADQRDREECSRPRPRRGKLSGPNEHASFMVDIATTRAESATDPEPIFRVASGFMAAKHLFAA